MRGKMPEPTGHVTDEEERASARNAQLVRAMAKEGRSKAHKRRAKKRENRRRLKARGK